MQLLGATGVTALAGCDAASEALARLAGSGTQRDFGPPDGDRIDAVTHALNRLTWGPRPGDYQRVRTVVVEAFVEEQLDDTAINDRACDWRVASIETVHEPTAELYEFDSRRLLSDLTRLKIMRGVYSRRQLNEVMVDFWSDHLNIASPKGDCRWLKVADDRDVIRRHALGRFRDLIRASAL